MTQELLFESESAAETLALLETRLRRLEYLVNGQSSLRSDSSAVPEKNTSDDERKPPVPVTTRISTLEHDLQKLGSKSPLVSEVLRLHSLHPSLFHPVPPTSVPDPSLTDANLASVVLACAASFPETASRLQALKDCLPVPAASASEQLIRLQPRLDEVVRTRQETLDTEVAELRLRSVALLRRWLELGVVAQGEVWAEWAEALDGLDRKVGWIERAREGERLGS